MKKEDVESKAKKAIELVQGVDDEFKTAAFSVIFERILSTGDALDFPPKQETEYSTDSGSKVSDIQKKKEELAKNCGVSIKELEEVLYFDKDIIKVIAPLSGSEPEKQLLVAKCVLTAFDVVLEQQWIKAIILSRCVGASKVGQLAHLSKNLQRDKQSIRLQGNRKSTEYKITEYGKATSYEIIKKLAKGGNLDES